MASLLSLFRTKPKSMPEATAVTTEEVELFLAKYDRSQDRHLDEYELRAAFKDFRAYFPSWRAERALKLVDKDSDGHINFSELRDLLIYAIQQGYKIR